MGQLRVIAGELKGRRIRVARGVAIRPTAERVREALFSILNRGFAGCRVMDAYAGSGALGFEALSRGAAEVLFVEVDCQTARAIRRTAEEMGVGERCSVLEGQVRRVIAGGRVAGDFALILADPPYDDADEVVGFLPLAAQLLAESGRIVLERDAHRPAASCAALRLERTARYGRSCLDFYGAPS